MRFPPKIANDETFGEIKSCYWPYELSIYIKIRTKSEYQFPTPTVRPFSTDSADKII